MSTPQRVACRQRLLSFIRMNLTGVQVGYSEPTTIERRSVWLGKVEGVSTIRTLKAGRKNRADTFTIEVFCFALASGDADGEESDVAVMELWEQVEDIPAVHPFLQVDGDALPGLTGCKVTTVEGPNPGVYAIADGVVGFGSQVRAEIEFSTHLS